MVWGINVLVFWIRGKKSKWVVVKFCDWTGSWFVACMYKIKKKDKRIWLPIIKNSTLCRRCRQRRLCFDFLWFIAHPSVAPCFCDLSAPLTCWEINNINGNVFDLGEIFFFLFLLVNLLSIVSITSSIKCQTIQVIVVYFSFQNCDFLYLFGLTNSPKTNEVEFT